MPKKEFFIKGKQEITDTDAPVISGEFVDTTREEGDYTGQTIEVHSETKLEQDTGQGHGVVMRTFEFAANPTIFQHGRPNPQAIFNSHLKGIEATLWQDGLEPMTELEPRLIFTKDKSKYLILVWSKVQRGLVSVENRIQKQAQTLSEIAKQSDSRQNSNKVHGGVFVPATKKKKTGRTAKAAE
jgi:hypothetical protein